MSGDDIHCRGWWCWELQALAPWQKSPQPLRQCGLTVIGCNSSVLTLPRLPSWLPACLVNVLLCKYSTAIVLHHHHHHLLLSSVLLSTDGWLVILLLTAEPGIRSHHATCNTRGIFLSIKPDRFKVAYCFRL